MRKLGLILILTAAITSMVGAADAQDSGDGIRISVMQAPAIITVSEGEPLVLWVREVDDGLASVVVLVENEEGNYTQLTPCDNVGVICQDALIPAEGTQEGDTFYLASE